MAVPIRQSGNAGTMGHQRFVLLCAHPFADGFHVVKDGGTRFLRCNIIKLDELGVSTNVELRNNAR